MQKDVRAAWEEEGARGILTGFARRLTAGEQRWRRQRQIPRKVFPTYFRMTGRFLSRKDDVLGTFWFVRNTPPPLFY